MLPLIVATKIHVPPLRGRWLQRPRLTDALNEKQRDAIMGTIPMGRLGQGGEIASAVVYLASDEAAYVTGQTLHVNGGMAMI